jgi:hypothetical protein
VAEPEVQAALPAPLDGSRLVALLSNGAATFEARADGVLLTPVELEGEVRSFELGPTRGRRIRIDAKVTGGGVVALWLASTSDLIEGPRSRK